MVVVASVMSAVLSASIFSTEEEADIREEKHSSNDGRAIIRIIHRIIIQ